MKNKLILTDCDGVLLNWNDAFTKWAIERGYEEVRSDVYDLHLCFEISKSEAKRIIRQFNESAAICQLDTFRDSKFWVKRIYEELGYKFRVITSMSLCPYAIKAREINLKYHFGDAIESLISLDTGANKDDVLNEYKDTGLYWVEDKPSNAVAGVNSGLKSILIEHDHNLDHFHEDIVKVQNWKQIYNIIKKA